MKYWGLPVPAMLLAPAVGQSNACCWRFPSCVCLLDPTWKCKGAQIGVKLMQVKVQAPASGSKKKWEALWMSIQDFVTGRQNLSKKIVL